MVTNISSCYPLSGCGLYTTYNIYTIRNVVCSDSKQQLKSVLNPYQKGGPGINCEYLASSVFSWFVYAAPCSTHRKGGVVQGMVTNMPLGQLAVGQALHGT